MSLIYLTFHNENIRDFDNVGDEAKPQKLKYKSKFAETIKKEAQQARLIATADGKKLLASSGKYDHRTMGYGRIPLNSPSEFMRKNQGTKWQRINDPNDRVCSMETNLPPIPPRRSADLKQQHSAENRSNKVNFIALNIDRVKQLQPKRPIPRYIDTASGDRHNLLNTGLVLQYVNGKNFGKVPGYLRKHKKLAQGMMHDSCNKEKIDSGGYTMKNFGARKLTNEERESIIEGLKTNFLEQSKNFQRLSLYTDTLAKKQRKSRIENILRQLEQDIYLMEKHSDIYVTNY